MTKFLQMIAKPAAWGSGWTSAVLCFSAASGFYLAGQRGKAAIWAALGVIEAVAMVW